MVTKPIISSRIACWLLLLLEFNFEVIYKLGRDHVASNYLSRLKRGGDVSKVTVEKLGQCLYTIHEDWDVLYDTSWRHEPSLTISIGINKKDWLSRFYPIP